DPGVVADDRARLQHVERFALGQPLHDVDQNDVGIAALGQALRQGRANIAGPDNRDLRTTHPHSYRNKWKALHSARWRAESKPAEGACSIPSMSMRCAPASPGGGCWCS